MKRREFLATTGAIGAGAILPLSSCSPKIDPKFKMGYQLFSVHEDMMKDTLGTLKALKKMGYRDFEIYGFDPEKLTYYDLPAADFKKMLDDLELTATSGHYGFSDYLMTPVDDLKWYVDQCIKGANILNKAALVPPVPAPTSKMVNFSPLGSCTIPLATLAATNSQRILLKYSTTLLP